MKKICTGVTLVASDTLSGGGDALGYLVQGESLVLIDAGSKPSSGPRILDNVAAAGHDPRDIEYLVLTHGHVDHIGGALPIREQTGCKIVAHELDCSAIETGDPVKTASSWYGTTLPELKVDLKLKGDSGTIGGLNWVHTPGHTPGSIVLYWDGPDGRILFGQDIHGPFLPEFGSDIEIWAQSMLNILSLKADILAEGHFGIFKGKEKVRNFIQSHLKSQGVSRS